MAEKIKGITLEIGGNTAGLNKALGKVNYEIKSTQGELKEVERLLKLDPNNTDLLAQKQELLAKQVSLTTDKLKALKKAKEESEKNGKIDEFPEQYRKLTREIIKSEQSLKDLDSATDKASEGLKEVGQSAEKAGDRFTVGKGAIADFIGNGLSSLPSKLSEISQETLEYKEDMNKLNTAFETSGKSATSAKNTYEGFFQILGESDRSVEAVNHLSELCKTEEQLNQWTNICAGVTAKFGDSLPIEGLTEASNETAKVGQVTGVLADALNWVGISEDDFNKKLSLCRNEQERSKLITDTLNDAYDESAQKYKEMNKDIMENRQATQEYNDAMSQVGDLVRPILTDIIKAVSEIITWMVDNSSIVIAGIAGIGTAFVTWNVATMINGVVKSIQAFKLANEGATIAQWALNTAMNANPIGIVVALIAGLVAAIVVLWNKNEGFRNACINAWESIKNAFQSAINSIKGFFNKLITWLKEFPSKMVNIGKNIVEGIWKGITNAKEWLKNKIKGWVDGILSNIKDFFGIHSPSTKTAEFGKYLSQGLGVGITEDMSAEKAMQQKCQNLTNILNEWLNNVTSDTDIANKQLELWQLQNPNATETEKADMTLKNLNVQRENSEDKIKLINDALWEQNQLTGENSAESKALQKQLLEEQIAYEKLADSIEEANTAKFNAMALDKYNEDVKRDNYYNYLKQNTALLKSVGYSQSQIEEAARKDSGYTGDKNVTIQQNFYTQTATPSSTYNATKKAMNDASVAVAF